MCHISQSRSDCDSLWDVSSLLPSDQLTLINILVAPAPSPPVRTLYGSARLGVDAYVQKREKLALQLAGSKDEFYQRMTGFAEGREALVTAADLTQMLHVATAEEQDQTLLQRMLTR